MIYASPAARFLSLIQLTIRVCESNIADGEAPLLSELPVGLHDKLVEELVVSVVVAYRHHNDPTRFQLVDECLRHGRRDCTSMDDIVGCSILLSFSSIATINFDASILELLAVALRQVVNAELCQLFDVLDSDDVRRTICVLGQLVERCAQVAASTPDVEDSRARSKFRLQPLHTEAV